MKLDTLKGVVKVDKRINDKQHKRMIEVLWRNPEILRRALSLPFIWIRTMEYVFDPATQEKIDLVFQDKYNEYRAEPDTVCFVVELKSDTADHEVIGQLKKAVQTMQKKGKKIGHWHKTVGISIAKGYTNSGLKLLWEEGYRAFQWIDSGKEVRLKELSDPTIIPKKQPETSTLSKSLLQRLKAVSKNTD